MCEIKTILEFGPLVSNPWNFSDADLFISVIKI